MSAIQKMWAIFFASASSGLPIALVTGTLQAWLVMKNVDLTSVGLFTLVSLPYSIKFLWAPLTDYYSLPFLSHRRAWLVIFQLGVGISLCGMSIFDPLQSKWIFVSFAILVSVFSASQDATVDAYKTEQLHENEMGTGAALSYLGYRIGVLISSGIALILANWVTWPWVYTFMAVLMLSSIINTLFAPEASLRKDSIRSPLDFSAPWLELFGRTHWKATLAFVVLYRLDDIFALAMQVPFLLSQGYSAVEIGVTQGTYGIIFGITGTFLGGVILNKVELRYVLCIIGIFQGISELLFFQMARISQNHWLLVSAISIQCILNGMGNAALTVFLMKSCNPKYTAAQYSLFTGLMAITRVFVGTPAGWLVKMIGWKHYYLFAPFLAIPGILLAYKLPKSRNT